MTEPPSNASNPQPSLKAPTSDDADDPPSSGNANAATTTTVTTREVKEGVEVKEGQAPRRRRPHRKRARILAKLQAHFIPTRPLGPTPTYAASLKAAALYTPLNLCLLFIPISWALHFSHQSATLVFIFSALGILPLAAMLGLGTEQIALRTSHSVGGLVNATLGNVVELIIAGIALKQCKLELVQSSLLGGLLSNMLLVLGMAFVVGGFRFPSQEFQPMVAQLNSSLMVVAVISLIVPAAFHEFLEDRLENGEEVPVLLQLSRGSAVILIIMYDPNLFPSSFSLTLPSLPISYIAYLVFQFYSHSHLFISIENSPRSSISSHRSDDSDADSVLPVHSSSSSLTSHSHSTNGEERVRLNTPVALFLLVASTALAYVTAEHLVDSLEGLVASNPAVSEKWLTLIVIPIISNAAEHVTAVVVARKGKFDLAMSVAIGSCIQIALFVIPVLVLVAWGMDKPLTLLFDPLETLVLFLSVLLVKFSLEDGKSHWMSGVVFISVYILIALSFWNFPDSTRIFQGQELVCT
ncbi:Sodium/calcium exchanger protein-domain-containing protein [Favolaschia claudopus]|uniref:Sodium/calcium exchanger protein-domain-containing protein n=1 Tax=Favolaschia claudopus TaxID=2862362 RepID=A0AAW0DIP6_9AGAR